MTKKKRKRKKKLQMKNKRLVKKWYWLKPRNVWTSKPLKDYDYTFIEWGWCNGWDKAFGQMFMDELGAAIKEAGQKDYMIVQIKEKYGSLRLYDSGSTEKVERIIDKYEIISQNICMNCGHEAPMINNAGWIMPMCQGCYRKYYRRREKWKIDHYSDYVSPTDEEIQEMYENIIMDNPDKNGEYHMPDAYQIHRLNGDEVVDISDTVNKVRKRIAKFKGV